MASNDRANSELLQVDALNVKYFDPAGRRDVMVVRDVSLTVRRGEVLAVTGQSGAGKSTLGMAIMGLLEENPRVVSGEIRFEGASVRAGLARARSGDAFMIFQEPRASLNPYVDVGAQVDECLRLRHGGLRRAETERRRDGLLKSVGIPVGKARSLPSELSTGQCQRVMIAMALALEARLLLGDEPLARLDFRVGRQLLALLQKLKEERHVGMLMLTHDMYLIRQLADRVAVIYGGEFVEEGPCDKVLGGDGPNHPYTRALCRAYDSFTVANISGRRPPSEGCGYAAHCPTRADECLTTQPALAPAAEDHRVRCPFARKN